MLAALFDVFAEPEPAASLPPAFALDSSTNRTRHSLAMWPLLPHFQHPSLLFPDLLFSRETAFPDLYLNSQIVLDCCSDSKTVLCLGSNHCCCSKNLCGSCHLSHSCPFLSSLFLFLYHSSLYLFPFLCPSRFCQLPLASVHHRSALKFPTPLCSTI